MVVADVVRTAEEIEDRYSPDEARPLAGYLGAMGVYAAVVLITAILLRRRHEPLPDQVSAGDLALISVATHKLSRTIAKDAVTSPVRAPFTRYKAQAGPGELNEEVRVHGWAHGIGELLTCPFCLAQWVATAFVIGLVVAPRATRLVASVFAARAGADVLQFAYVRLEAAD